tara:strand:- start:573 stop:764 length:192 start_codon:yes stop_codon:yes gene_type:complete
MSIESLNRTSNVINDPSQVINARVNVDVLKRRLIEQQKKDKIRTAAILSSIFVSVGLLGFIFG